MLRYEGVFPVLLCSWQDSAGDALAALSVPSAEIMNLVVAAWSYNSDVILTDLRGGRAVAAVFFPDGHWAACNAYPAASSMSLKEADRYLRKLTRGNRQGWLVATMTEGGVRLIR